MDIFSYISKSNANICSQLSEIICIISQNDFPESWPGLIDQLLSEIDSSNFSANLVILRTCHNIFKRYRLEERSDDLYREINFVMEKFGPALLQIFVGIDGLLKSGNIDRSALELILQNATYANKIFYSLSYQDIPAFFEDNLSSFMTVLMSFYNFHAPDIMSVDNEQPGVLEKFTSSVAKIVILYSTKYEEDFSMLSEFAQATWSILTSRATLYPKDDKLTCTCIEFLASVSKQERHKLIFQNSLKVICDSIIIPNMKLRESDLEIFEDEPMEFIKRDSESSDGLSHRHSSAVSLIHGLMEFYGPEITQILCETVTKSLAYYADNTSKNWQSKLLATQVFSAVGARGYAEAFGVTSMNPLVNIRDYFNSQVFADLKSSDTSIHPLLTLEAIKFVIYYRNQLGKDDLAQCLPFILTLLESENFIIHTFSAIAIEKILSIKRNGDNLFAISDISSVVGRLSLNILALIFNQKTVEKMCENYFLIKGTFF
jgi:exportin-2 (importin alpha re-exporter)